MRIRKHALTSPLVYTAASSLNRGGGGGVIENPHVCQLNQSPWDVLSFPLSEYLAEDPTELLTPPPPPPPPLPVDGELSSMENGSVSEFPEAENSGLSMNLEKWDEVIDKNGKLEYEGNGEMNRMSDSSHFRKKIKGRHSNYRVQLKKHYRIAKKPVKNNPDTRRRLRPKKPVSSSNPYEYYYYSGFGPRWGKNRRGSMDVTNKVEGRSSYNSESLLEVGVIKGDQGESYNTSESLENDNVIEEDKQTASPPQRMVFEDSSPARARICNFDDGFDYDDDDEEEDENEEFVTRKRARKPIKARSLKSLMYKRT